MPLEQPETGWVWLRIPVDECVECVIIGEAQTWWTHWYKPHGSRWPTALRCVAYEAPTGCDWCRAGYERRTRYVIPVTHEGHQRLLELGRVQYPALCAIESLGQQWVGSVLRLARERPHRNAPVTVRRIGHTHVSLETQVDIAEHVKGLGRRELRLLDVPDPLPEHTQRSKTR
jgi:hypothetical protein